MVRKAHGFALIDLIFVCGIIGVLCATALPRLLMARQAASATSAIASLRTLNSAELSFALTCAGGFYATDLTKLGTAPPGSNEAFVSEDLGKAVSVVKSGYLIQLDAVPYAGAPQACNGGSRGESARGYAAAADPVEPGNQRFFATNADSVIWEDTSSLYMSMPELGTPPAGAALNHW
jgi:hypothetical protein